MTVFLWATVRSVSPLTVAFDGSATELAAVKAADLTLAVGDRVRVERADVLVVHLRVA